jgi:hypothetical protein
MEESSEGASFRWLMKLPIGRGCHIFLESCQDVFHGITPAPLRKHSKMPRINNSGFLVDRIHVDPRVESDTGRSIRIFLVTKELDSVNAPFMN